MGCGDSKNKATPPATAPANKETAPAPTPAAKKDPVGTKPRVGDIVTVSGKGEAKVLTCTTTDFHIEYRGSGKVEWVDAEDVMVTKGRVPLPEVKPGIEVTTTGGLKGKVTKRTTTEVYFSLDSGEETFADIEDITVIKVTIASATNLANTDLFSKSDPYCTCELVGKPSSRVKSAMVKDNLNPEWNFEANVLGYNTGDSLLFEVWDKDMITDEYLGKCTLEHEKFHGNTFVGEVPLLDKKGEPGQGSLKIRAEAENAPKLFQEAPEPKKDGPTPFEAESKKVEPSPWGCC